MSVFSAIRWTALLLALGINTAGRAEDKLVTNPAEQFSMTPGGVDLRTGKYIYSHTDVAVGGEGSGGLALVRSTTNDVQGHIEPFGTFSHNWNIFIVERRINIETGAAQGQDYRMNVTFGGLSETFRAYAAAGQNFEQVSRAAHARLTYVGDKVSGSTVYTLTAADGTIARFRPIGSADCSSSLRCAFVSEIIQPDGTKLTFAYAAGSGGGNNARLKSVTSSRGFALVLEGGGSYVTKACALNLAVQPLPGTGICPAGAISASYSYSGGTQLLAMTDPTGQVWGFSGGFTRPGETTPWLVNTTMGAIDSDGVTYRAVSRQTFSTGEYYDYAYYYPPPVANVYQAIAGGSYTNARGETWSALYDFPITPGTGPGDPCTSFPCTMPGPDNSHIVYQQTPGPATLSDPLYRTTTFDYCDPVAQAGLPSTYENRCYVDLLQSFTDPEGIRTELTYDGNRNIVQAVRRAKPGSGQADIVTSATYNITNPLIAAKPQSMTDAKGNVTNFSYDPTHGGILKRTGPADASGVRPETRYAYAQKYAWVRSGGGWVQAATPVWVPVSEEMCRTSAADAAGNCAAGALDEVVTTYEYEQGSASKGSNLLVKGVAVTGLNAQTGQLQTLRTCYGYDEYGRRTSERKPAAGLGACP